MKIKEYNVFSGARVRGCLQSFVLTRLANGESEALFTHLQVSEQLCHFRVALVVALIEQLLLLRDRVAPRVIFKR